MADVRAPPRKDPVADGLPHCIACGCCCFSVDPEYVRVFGIDLERMDEDARSYTIDRGGRVAMRLTEGRCAALILDVTARTFVCAIYEQRPDVCRSLARASGGCLADRRDKADKPLLALATLTARRAGRD